MRLRTFLTSLLAVSLTAALPAAAGADITPPASGDPGAIGAGWIARELTEAGGSFGIGATTDAILALDAVGVAQDVAATALSELEADIQTAGDLTAGVTAKAILAVAAQGANPADFGGRDLDAELRAKIAPDGSLGFDMTGPTNSFAQYFIQSLGVQAFFRTAGGVPPETVDFLLGGQCDDGGFSLGRFAAGSCTSNIDTTGLAVHALFAATSDPDAGTDINTARTRAVDYLVAQQGSDGFIGGPNANTTGLATSALARAGETAAVTTARTALRTLQVVCFGPEVDRGAFAFAPELLDEAEDGIDDGEEGGFLLATSQAVLAYAGVGYDQVTNTGASTFVPTSSCFTEGFCPDDAGVTVVVDQQDLVDDSSAVARCVEHEDGMDGIDALLRAGHTLRLQFFSFGVAVCEIDSSPDIEGCFGDGFWSYWQTPRNGEFDFAATGPVGAAPMPGDVEGWSYTTGSDAPRVDVRVASAAAFLRGQLVDGERIEGDSGVEVGTTIDVALALLVAGTEPAALRRALDFLTSADTAGAYVGDGDERLNLGGAAKLGLLVDLAGGNTRDVGGLDLVTLVQAAEGSDGRFTGFPAANDFSGAISQAFAVLFLTSVQGFEPSADAVTALVDSACDDGGFTFTFGDEDCDSGADATGIVLQALGAARDRSDTRQNAIDAALAFLDAVEAADGSFGNANSTGYAAMGRDAVGVDDSEQTAYLDRIQNLDGAFPAAFSRTFATARALPTLAGTSYHALVAPLPADPVREPAPVEPEPTEPEPSDPGPTNPEPVFAAVERTAGSDRYETAIKVSRGLFADGGADAVVLSRGDLFPDALAGGPVAVEVGGPLLLTQTSTLRPEVLVEIQRVLRVGGTVHLLGGELALSDDVRVALVDAGFVVNRIAGENRYATSVAAAEFLGNPELQLLTTGLDFPDAVAAGAAAGAKGGAVLLTVGAVAAPEVSAYLAEHDGDVTAIGGPAAAAYPNATKLVGEDRNETAALVATEFFDAPDVVGLARNDDFADALSGGVELAYRNGPLVLVGTTELPDATADLLCGIRGTVTTAKLFGGPVAIVVGVEEAVTELLRDGTGCPIR